MIHSEKFQDKYISLAKHFANENDICGSRKVAAIIVDNYNRIKGIGYNGPPAGTPHCNESVYLDNIVRPMLSVEELESLTLAYGDSHTGLHKCTGCPRKFFKYESGEKPEMCSCQHAESNAIVNAAADVSGCAIYCTLSPCFNCTGMIINARIHEVHFPLDQNYPQLPQVRFLLARAQIEIVPH